jgi:SM-20-related protein
MLLNPDLDLAALAARYHPAQRLQIRDVLVPALADEIWQCLMRETPWGVSYNKGGRNFHIPAEELRGLSAARRRAIADGAQERARDGYQFLYQAYMMRDRYLAEQEPGLFLHDVLEMLNGPQILETVRGVTGIATIVQADAQATLFAPGHFLCEHDDGPEQNMRRRVAYVLSLTKEWKADFGGLLHFLDEDDDVTATFVPRFNALSLFTVPQWHAVTAVSAFAPIGRLSIAGWFLDPD